MANKSWDRFDEEASREGKATLRMRKEFYQRNIKSCKGTKSATSPDGRMRLAVK